jgi:hypothetical protein
VLFETLEGTPYADRLVSSKPIVASLRGRKSPFEIARIRGAVDEAEERLSTPQRELWLVKG